MAKIRTYTIGRQLTKVTLSSDVSRCITGLWILAASGGSRRCGPLSGMIPSWTANSCSYSQRNTLKQMSSQAVTCCRKITKN